MPAKSNCEIHAACPLQAADESGEIPSLLHLLTSPLQPISRGMQSEWPLLAATKIGDAPVLSQTLTSASGGGGDLLPFGMNGIASFYSLVLG
jgi:hypothetical protein